MRRALLVVSVLVVAVVAVLVAFAFQSHRGPRFTTPYQAVLLDNGVSFYGRLERVDDSFPVLRDVFYVESRANPETKQMTNVLVRRGQEWHGPDNMVLSGRHIVLIEPVREDSHVAKLIEEQRRAR